MKIALVQMSMGKEISENLDKSLKYCDMAENCDLVFFPEIQLTPFFPQYHNICVDHYCIDMDNDALVRLCQKAREHRYYLSPNVYLESEGARYDTSLWISPEGKITSHRMKIFMSRIIIHRRRTALKFLPHHLERSAL